MSIAVNYQNGIWEDGRREEILGGKVYLAPSPIPSHSTTEGNVAQILRGHLWNRNCNSCRVFQDMDVRLTPDDLVRPDISVVCNPEIITAVNIEGAPDLVVEVLSRSTAKRDRGYKKQLYERCGIKEYWIVDAVQRSIEVYLLENDKYELSDIYILPTLKVLASMHEEEKEELVYEFKTHLFDDLIIDVRDVFRGIDE